MSDKPKLRPILNNVVLKRDEPETMSPGGIIIPLVAQRERTEAIVEAVGPGAVNKHGAFVPTTLVPGDRVLLSQWTGYKLVVDNVEFLIAAEEEILAIIVDDDAPPTDRSPSI